MTPSAVKCRVLLIKLSHPDEFTDLVRFFSLLLQSRCPKKPATSENTAGRWIQTGVNAPYCKTSICPRSSTANHVSPSLLEIQVSPPPAPIIPNAFCSTKVLGTDSLFQVSDTPVILLFLCILKEALLMLTDDWAI